MCEFKSAIVLKDEKEKGGFRLLMSPWTESHSELVQLFNLNDKANARLYFARVEYSPKDLSHADDLSTYVLKLDEERKPSWWTDEIEEDVETRMKAYIKRIIISGDVALLCGGQFILAKGAKVESAHSMVINAMLDGSTVNYIKGGTVNYISGGTVNYISGGTVNYIGGGTVNYIWGGTVNDIKGGTVNCISGGTIVRLQNYGGDLVVKNISKLAKVVEDLRKKP